MRLTLKTLAIGMTFLAGYAFATTNTNPPNVMQEVLESKVRHELLMLPYFGVFDNLQFRVDGTTVTLLGEATRPTLRSDAGNVVKRIEGVTAVNNEIEVLPLSRFDDQLRLRVARSIYGQTALNRYALGAHPSIHIVVKNGNVTLEGIVANKMDASIANIQANSVFGAFSVKNNLQIER